MKIPFTKMHGTGNDYVYVDTFNGPIEDRLPGGIAKWTRQISHRRYGIGADGLIVIHPSDSADARMQMFNADGGEGEMCGNGIRCVAKYVYDNGLCKKRQLKIQTGAGIRIVDLNINSADLVEDVTVDMGEPILEAAEVPTTLLPSGPVIDHAVDFGGRSFNVTCVSVGNPHCVIFVPEITDELVLGFGPKIELDPRFPNRVNIEFVEVLSRTELRQRTWERGSGETYACGTGASAVCVAGHLTGRTDREVLIHLTGGDLTIKFDDGNHVQMTGGATTVFKGEF